MSLGKRSVCLLLLAGALLLAACSPAAPVPTADLRPLQTAAVQTAFAELTRMAPSATPTPTITPSPTLTLTPTITPTPTRVVLSLEDNVAIYMVNILDAEACSYEILPIPVVASISGDVESDTTTAIRFLLNTKWQVSGFLTNPLSTSNLQITGIDMDTANMVIHLSGVMSRYDDECTNYQARDQLWATASRYNTNRLEIAIWVDSLLFDDFMIGR